MTVMFTKRESGFGGRRTPLRTGEGGGFVRVMPDEATPCVLGLRVCEDLGFRVQLLKEFPRVRAVT